MKNIKLKRLIITMGLITAILSFLGCNKNGHHDSHIPKFGGLGDDIIIDDFDGEISEEGNDYSQDGEGEYKGIVGFEFGKGGYTPGFSYNIYKDGGKMVLEYEGNSSSIRNLSCTVDDETMTKLAKLCAKLNIQSWDKYNKSARGVLDGDGFALYVCFEDGTTISASGENRYPKNYAVFEEEVIKILKPLVDESTIKERDKMFKKGLYNGPLDFAMINYTDRGASGSDSYSFLISRGPDNAKVEITVKSVSGDFVEPGNYTYRGNPDNSDELLDEIQEVLNKYKVYRWDGYDESTPDYNDREWFQLCFDYEEAAINCCGCGDTENYEEVRKEILEILARYMKGYDCEIK